LSARLLARRRQRPYTAAVIEDLPGALAGEGDAEDDDPKRRKREAKLLAESTRSLEAWERYRTLVDALEEANDLVELADRKARFALLIMGALNVSFFFLVTRSELVDTLSPWLRGFLGFYLLAYAAVALYFFLQAIETLRPRRYRPQLSYPGEAGGEHFPDGLRYYEDVVLRDLEAYRRAWREVRFGQLNAELAVQNHVMARINFDKFRSLRRLYAGLRVLAVLAGGLLAMLALSLLGSARPLPLSSRKASAFPVAGAGNPLLAPADLRSLGPAVPVRAEGLVEASGIAWHPALKRFFAVGDRGTLAELAADGSVQQLRRVRGNLEDVTVHLPSGRLVLLAEKKGELVVWDPRKEKETARFPLDVAALLDREPADRNQGFEGIGFRAEPGLPGGGTFYLVHQRKPARLIALSFDPLAPPRPLGAADVHARHALKPYEDLTAVTWSDALASLLVVADSEDRLLLVSPAGTIRAAVALPGDRQEGIALDPEGALWIADDRQGLFRIPGALAALAKVGEASS
jgi:uncharacterized protein YjiK